MSNSRSQKALSLATAAVLTLVSFVLPATPVMAQATSGNIVGTVTDAAGGAVVGAKVTAKNKATGQELTGESSGEGTYRIANVPPGLYDVTVEQTGFKKGVFTDFNVGIGTDNPLNPVLTAGDVTESVTVVAGGEEVAQVTSQVSSSFESRRVEELPSNAAGGGIDTLALLAPGVVPGFGNVNSNGVTLSVNGNRARSNNFTLDGTDNNDLTIGGPNFFVSNADSVQEFQLITNNFSAEYGRNQGAVINIVTKGGGNEFHGTAFEFHRNSSALDAKTNIERADPTRGTRDKFISNVFGGTFGGPVIRDKAFFFVDGQLVRQRQSFNFQAINPAISPAGLATLAANFPGNPAIAALVNQSVFAIQPGARQQANSATGTLCFPRDPTLPCTGANAVNVQTVYPEFLLGLPFDQKEYGLRGDVNVTNKDSFNVKYRYQQSPETNFNTQTNGFFGDIPFSSRNLNGQYTRTISSRATNQFTAATQKLSLLFGGCEGAATAGCILDPTGGGIGRAFTNITFTGITTAGATLQSVGPATNVPQGREVKVTQFADNFQYTVGRHTLKMGADFRFLKNDVPFLPNFNGAFRFNSTARIVANAPSFVQIGAGEPEISYKERDQFYYFQDDFKVRENLTLNLGVRYEYTGQPVNTLHELTLARESDPATALFRQNIPVESRIVPRIPADKNNFAPRVGFAYTPRFGGDGMMKNFLFGDNDATVIRGGYSIAYDPAFYNILLNVSTSSPTVFLNTINNNTSLTAPLFRLPASPTGDVVRQNLGSFLQRNTFDPRLLTQTQVSPDFHSPYSQQWSLGVQRQINRNNVFEARYVGNAGVGLFQTINRNPDIGNLFKGFTSAGFGDTAFTFPGFPGRLNGAVPQTCVNDPATPDNEGVCNNRLIAGRGLIRSRENTGFSNYHGLQTRYNGRLLNQLTFGASYTFSKTIDNVSEVFSFGENALASNPFDNQNERGLSGNDRRHASSFNFLWDVPYQREQRGAVGRLLGGWQINGTYVLADGRPFTPSQFYNVLGLPSYQDFNFVASFAGFDAIRPFTANPGAPRNTVGITDVDASFFGFTGFTPSPTGLYSLNELNRTGTLVPVTTGDVRFIFNGPGAAQRFNNPFGNVGRNSERGPALNQLNLGFFKNTKVRENLNVQFRAELFNALNHPNSGYGVAAGATLPDTFVEDAGFTGVNNGFNDPRLVELSSRRVQFGIRIVF